MVVEEFVVGNLALVQVSLDNESGSHPCIPQTTPFSPTSIAPDHTGKSVSGSRSTPQRWRRSKGSPNQMDRQGDRELLLAGNEDAPKTRGHAWKGMGETSMEG